MINVNMNTEVPDDRLLSFPNNGKLTESQNHWLFNTFCTPQVKHNWYLRPLLQWIICASNGYDGSYDYETIAKNLKVSIKTVQRHKSELIKVGIIDKKFTFLVEV